MERGESLQLFPRSLAPYTFSCGSLSFPLVFLAGELGDVDQSPDSRNNREPERKNDLLSLAAYSTHALRLMAYDATDGQETWLEAYSYTSACCRELRMKMGLQHIF